jgi:tRNA threonylcarbamoyladenosine modification (KEOPS) complex  Pcc1 subunit
METITLQPLLHRGKECIGIYFKQQQALNNIVRAQKNAKWSHSNKCWYVPLYPEAYEDLKHCLQGKAILDISLLKTYLHKKKLYAGKAVNADAPVLTKPAESKPAAAAAIKPAQVAVMNKVSSANFEQLDKCIQLLKLKAYSSSTIRTYRNEFLQLLQTIGQKRVEELTVEQLKR